MNQVDSIIKFFTRTLNDATIFPTLISLFIALFYTLESIDITLPFQSTEKI